MYYEEKIIDDILYYRTNPAGNFIPMSKTQLTARLIAEKTKSKHNVYEVFPGYEKILTGEEDTPLSNQELTEIYNKANNISTGKKPHISTEYIFNSMRLAYELGKLDK